VEDPTAVPKALFGRAKYVVVEEECNISFDDDALDDFVEVTKRRRITFYRRKADGEGGP
jgi:hypothetical protein